jgi:hypothetical protein
MSLVIPDTDGSSHRYCKGGDWRLVHDGSKAYVMGHHCGQTSAGPGRTIEYFDTELELDERIVFLDLDISEL